jgi:choline-sulfatase
VLEHTDPQRVHREVLESQRRRRLVFAAHMSGVHTPWDFQPVEDASRMYMRNHLDLNDVEKRARIDSRQE